MPLIFIHGFACSSTDWSHQLQSFAPQVAALAIDLPEQEHVPYAASPRDFAAHPPGYSIGSMADAVNRLSQHRPSEPVILVGHSLGCRVAVEAARRAPQSVAGLVLIEGSLRAIIDPQEATEPLLRLTASQIKASLLQDFLGMFGSATPSSFRTRVLRRFAAMRSELAARLLFDMTWWDAAEAAKALRCLDLPLLAIQSTCKDPGGVRRSIEAGDTPPWIHLLQQCTSRPPEVVRLTGLCHFPQIEAPAHVNAAIQAFLENRPAAPLSLASA